MGSCDVHTGIAIVLDGHGAHGPELLSRPLRLATMLKRSGTRLTASQIQPII